MRLLVEVFCTPAEWNRLDGALLLPPAAASEILNPVKWLILSVMVSVEVCRKLGPSTAVSSFQLVVFGDLLTAVTSEPGAAAWGIVNSTGTYRQQNLVFSIRLTNISNWFGQYGSCVYFIQGQTTTKFRIKSYFHSDYNQTSQKKFCTRIRTFQRTAMHDK